MLRNTRVTAHINGDTHYYYFALSKEGFMSMWNNQIPGCGYYTGRDEDGKIVIINPSNCGAIEIEEFKGC